MIITKEEEKVFNDTFKVIQKKVKEGYKKYYGIGIISKCMEQFIVDYGGNKFLNYICYKFQDVDGEKKILFYDGICATIVK